MSRQRPEGMLGPYRVLDLTDEKGFLCGNLLGDLGADVIKIEKPGGDPSRNLGPFYHDEADPEKSLFWFAFNTSKRGITLDIESTEGKEIFKKLVKRADLVIESFIPGYLDKLGLGYADLEEVNRKIIMVSITPFGQDGPYKDYKAPDIVAFAMGGRMYPVGDLDRAPVRISHHSMSHLSAAGDGAVGAMLALRYRELTGEGEHVDVSIQESVALLLWAMWDWDSVRVIARRGASNPGELLLPRVWPCKDGYAIWLWWGGVQGQRRCPPFIALLDSEGLADDFLKKFNWLRFDPAKATPEEVDHLVKPAAELFRRYTKAELLEKAVKFKAMIGILATTTDLIASPQLAARGFWAKIEHPELGASLTYPGAFAHSTGIPPGISRRAPLIGEHNEEIYERELSLSRKEILELKQARVI